MGSDLSWLNQPLQTWFATASWQAIPALPVLDCRACTRAEHAGSAKESERWRRWKCCTFQPFVPNYLLGAMLADTGTLVVADHAVYSPLGLCPSAAYRERFSQTPDQERGGDFACAFFDQERSSCRVWKNRPGECSSYFCQPNEFFQERRSDLFEWENAVAQMALAEHGFEPSQIEALTDWIDWTPAASPILHWQQLAMSPEEFYLSCWQWAQKQSAATIYSWLSPAIKARFDTWLRLS